MNSNSQDGYEPRSPRIQNDIDRLDYFHASPITGNLSEVPNIGPRAKQKLAEIGITTTFGLIGQFLLLKEVGVNSEEHRDRFWYWLQSIGINGFRSKIVECIAEKCEDLFPNIYDLDGVSTRI